jgi:hypothetical protein
MPDEPPEPLAQPLPPAPGLQNVPASAARPPATSTAATQVRCAERAGLLEKLRAARGSDALIAYVTSTRPNLGAQMSQDAVRLFFDHLPAEPVQSLDLMIHSDGGDGIVPWRVMTLLRERAERVNVLVPHRAFSAATLTALGADEIVMHPMGMLGPIDPSVNTPFNPLDPQTNQRLAVSVEDVAAYNALVKDDVGIRHEDELIKAFTLLAEKVHPLTLGSAKRGTAQAQMLGERLLKLRNVAPDQHAIEVLLDQLTTKLYYHGHPIARAEARQLGLPVAEDVPAAVETAMWNVYLAYEQDLQLMDQFDPVAEALSVVTPPSSQAPPGMQAPMIWVARPDLLTVARVVIESSGRADVFENDLQISVARAPNGAYLANMVALRSAWITVSQSSTAS